MTPRSLMAFCREKGVKSVEIRYATLAGPAEHVQIPLDRLNEQLFETGMPLTSQSRLSSRADSCLLVPLAETAYLWPFSPLATLVLLGEVQDAVTRREDDFDSRSILQRAQDAWKNAGFGESILVGQTCEVLLLKTRKRKGDSFQVKFDAEDRNAKFSGDHHFESNEAQPSSTSSRATGPLSQFAGVSDMAQVCSVVVSQLGDVGISIDQATYSTSELGRCRFHLSAVSAVRAADSHLLCCEIIRATAERFGLSASFLPCSGSDETMLAWTLRLTAWKDQELQMIGPGQFELSDKAMAMAAGILAHLPSCTALCNPSENSFRRLNNLGRSYRKLAIGNVRQQSVLRVSSSENAADQKCLELTFADHTCNPYLALAGVLMAAVDGLEENYSLDDAGRSVKTNEAAPVTRRLPLTLDRALSSFRKDHTFLLSHDVFSEATIRAWAKYVRSSRLDAVSIHPNQKEFRSPHR